MLSKAEVGSGGETLAAQWLIRQGFTILKRNFRYSRYEIDIVASRNKILHIIEVKCRRSHNYGRPEESVSRKKLEHILQGGTGWLLQWPGHQRVQYDVCAVTLQHPKPPEYILFEDVYL
jgi:putative endonuclease